MTQFIPQGLVGKSFSILADSSSESFTIEERIVDSRSPIFISKSNKRNKLATKIYLYSDNLPNTFYLNESRYGFLRHSNVIGIRHKVDKFEIARSQNASINCSLVFMDLACCDLKDLLASVRFDEKLARTFFHHLVEGVSYIHSMGVSHLDLKLENLLLGADFNLKLADFDFAYKKGDLVLQGYGTENFRAPEIINKECRVPEHADIFSMGVILFCLIFGHIPFSEQMKIKDYDLFNLIMDDPEAYWEALKEIKGTIPVSDDFKDLLASMLCREPSERASLGEIKRSSWYKKPTYSLKELEALLKAKLPMNYLSF